MSTSLIGQTVIIIPCRIGSTRLPGKAMMKIAEKPLIHWVYDRAKQSIADHVAIATSDQVVLNYCRANKLTCRETKDNHPTGTHRCAEVLIQLKQTMNITAVINWQGDEPLVDPKDANRLLNMISTSNCGIATLASPITSKQLDDPNVTKVVESNGIARWFSRAPMRGSKAHLGIYAFAPSVLESLINLKPTPLSSFESLEQLVWLEKGFSINVLETERFPLAINSSFDLDEFRKLIEK